MIYDFWVLVLYVFDLLSPFFVWVCGFIVGESWGMAD